MREWQPVELRMRLTYFFTLSSARLSVSAIWWFERPSATSWTTWRCRSDSPTSAAFDRDAGRPRQIADSCRDHGTPASVCGELAGRPLEAFALTALGFDRLSMPPAGIGPVKRMVLSTDREAAGRGVARLIESGAGSVRDEIETLARKLNVAV